MLGIYSLLSIVPVLFSSLSPVSAAPLYYLRPRDSDASKSLFPMGMGSKHWTTASGISDAVPLNDKAFKIYQESSKIPLKYVDAPGDSSEQAIEAHYPEGAYRETMGPAPGGLSAYVIPEGVEFDGAKTMTYGYNIYFEGQPWGWEKGGKLPGLYGGNTESDARGCSGGRRSDDCFSARLMWRADGKGELYTYLPPSFPENQNFCQDEGSDCNPTYGASIGRGSFTFKSDAWNTVAQRVQLNDPGKANGELQLWFNGESVIEVKGLVLIDTSGEGRIRGIQMETFFGGHTSDYASPKDQSAFFKDFSVAILETM